jgi:1-acyl-sn-glycerol-3-phosphate acyltransferase
VLLAARSGAPILPVYIGKYPSLRARLRGERLHAYVGEPVTLDNTLRGRRAYGDAAEEVLRAIYALPGAGR